MSKKNKITDEDIQLFFEGKSKEQKELESIESSLEEFVEKNGGQYFCLVLWPTEDIKKRQKYEVGSGNHVRILPSNPRAPFGRALSAIFEWIRMSQAKAEYKLKQEAKAKK